MSKKMITKETTRHIDSEGNETSTEIETTKQIEVEEDYIKIYTEMWCVFNKIPQVWHELFLALAMRMSYCCNENLDSSQIVSINKITIQAIINQLKIKERQLFKGLKILVECNAIKKITRGVYQINPYYAGKGGWRYNPHDNRGGVKDLRAEFDFVDKTVKTDIVWADDGTDNELNKIYRDGLKTSKYDMTVLRQKIIKNKEEKQAQAEQAQAED